MKKTSMIFALAFILIISTLSSAYVIRDAEKEIAEQKAAYTKYKADYVKMNNLEGYEKYLSERNLGNNFGFYHPSRYALPRDVYNAKYNPPLQGEVYSSRNRPKTNSLEQPSAVKYYADSTNGRLSGFVQSDLNGVYFDHPDAKVTYGYIGVNSRYNSYPGAVGYENYGNEPRDARYYARIADQVSDDFYVVGFY